MFSHKSASALVTTVFGASLVASVYLGAVKHPPGVRDQYGVMHRYSPKFTSLCAYDRTISFAGEGSNQDNWLRCKNEFQRTGTLDQFNFRYWLIGGSAIGFLTSLFWLGPAWRVNRTAPKVVRGRSYFRGGKARRELYKASHKDCEASGTAMEFPKGIPFAWDRENRHIMIWGGVGSGKTQIMLNLMQQIIARGDKMLVLDTKGDMTASIAAPYTLIAPQDARSHVWNIAADCRTTQDARELAAKLIPEGHDRIWSDAARTVLTACLCKMLSTKPGEWTWADLRNLVTSDVATLRVTATDYYPQALHILSEDGGRTTQSILTTLQSHMQAVSALADAWGKSEGETFSVTDWINAPGTQPPLILQYDGKYPDLSNAWISSMVATLSGIISSPTFTEDKYRRIWLFLDEFPQLDELKHFSTLLDTGRSKGLCVVIGMQDFAQLRDTYGNHKADAWLGMIGTHIMTRMSLGRSAEEACRLIGSQDVDILHRTKNRSNGTVTYSDTVRTDTRPVVTGSDLASNLGPHKKGLRAIILGPGKDVYEIDFPYVTLAPKRSAASPARWTTEAPVKQTTQARTQPPHLTRADLVRIKQPKPE